MVFDLDINRLRAINEAIWIRDRSDTLDKEQLLKVIADIGEHKIFSARQIQSIAGNTISRQKISKLCQKSDRTGGSLQVSDLEKIRDLFYTKSNGSTNYALAKEIIENGTSQGMLSRLTGIDQSSISRKIRNIK